MSKTVLEFITSLAGGPNQNPPDLYGEIRKLPDGSLQVGEDRVMEEFDIVANTTPVGFDYKNGRYVSSEYISKFLGKETNNIKENVDMKKSIIDLMLEQDEVTNSQGFIGIGEDDDMVGAPGFDSDDTVDDGLGDMADEGEDFDSELDKQDSVDTLFGNDNLPGGDKVAESTITKKSQYKRAVDHLFANLSEISVIEHLPVEYYNTEAHKTILTNLYKSITESVTPILWESLSEEVKVGLAENISYYQKGRQLLLSKPTKSNARIVESYLRKTSRFLREVNKRISEGFIGAGVGMYSAYRQGQRRDNYIF